MGVTADEVVGARGTREGDEVVVARVGCQPRLRRRVVGGLGLETECIEQFLGVARLEVAGDLRPLEDARELGEA